MTPPRSSTNGPPSAADDQRARLAAGQECLQAALQYLDLGWSALPICPPDHVGVGKKHGKDCKNPGKAPVVRWKEYQDRLPTQDELCAAWKNNPTLNVGIALGPVSGLVRVDVDGPGGEQKIQQISGGDLPATLEFTSGRLNGGRGLLYRIPVGIELRTTSDAGNKKEEMRFQAKGSQTVLPPSRHVSGSRYRWKEGHGPDDIRAAMAPAWLLRELEVGHGPTNNRPKTSAHAERISEGSRNSTLTSLAGAMRHKGFSQAALEAALLAENQERCEPPLDDEEVRGIARSVGRYDPGPVPGASGYELILEYFREEYHPVFRRGPVLYSGRLGREVRVSEACHGAPIQLIERLAGAQDAPKRDDGTANRARLPQFFSTWVKSAWGDLLRELPEEEAAGEISATAKEEFEARLTEVLHTIVALGHEYKQGTETISKIERRSLLEWCLLFAKPGPWKSVRSYRLWAKKEKEAVCIAMRAELFGQVNKPRITQRQLGELAELYSLGVRTKVASQRAIELTQEFLADQLETFGRTPPKTLPPESSAQAKNEGSLYGT